MKKIIWVAACGMFVHACNGTETQNPASPLKGFGDSGCKKLAKTSLEQKTLSQKQAVVSSAYGVETAGLKCFAWESAGTTLKVDLYNFEGPCGAEWTGNAKLDDEGALSLGLENPGCRVASCGWCIYDWSFELEGIDTSKPLSVVLGIDKCPGTGDIVSASAVLPLDSQAEGISCNYANWNALTWQAAYLGTCGTVGMPCRNGISGLCSEGPTDCEDGLVCGAAGAPGENTCIKACSSDVDCGSSGVLRCEESLCRPKSNW